MPQFPHDMHFNFNGLIVLHVCAFHPFFKLGRTVHSMSVAVLIRIGNFLNVEQRMFHSSLKCTIVNRYPRRRCGGKEVFLALYNRAIFTTFYLPIFEHRRQPSCNPYKRSKS